MYSEEKKRKLRENYVTAKAEFKWNVLQSLGHDVMDIKREIDERFDKALNSFTNPEKIPSVCIYKVYLGDGLWHEHLSEEILVYIGAEYLGVVIELKVKISARSGEIHEEFDL